LEEGAGGEFEFDNLDCEAVYGGGFVDGEGHHSGKLIVDSARLETIGGSLCVDPAM
jgi:hypothetical protein